MSEQNIGANIRKLRTQSGKTLTELAKQAKITKSTLSKIEMGQASPPVSTLMRIAEAMGISSAEFFQESDAHPRYVLTRKGKGRIVPQDGSKLGYSYEALALGMLDKQAEPFLLTVKPSDPAGGFQHGGQEFIYMLAGQLEVTLGDEVLRLESGDSLYLDASYPHKTKAMGKTPAKFICVFINSQPGQVTLPEEPAAKKEFEFVRLVGNERRVGSTLASVSRHWRKEEECFLFVSPHDDDVIIGGALTIMAALKEKVPVHVAVVTDGAMGYCSLKEKNSIAAIRRDETYAAFKILGFKRENIHRLEFPDCQLRQYTGRRSAKAGEAAELKGFTGLQNSFTELLRRVKPTQIFMPTSADLHPDHQIVHSEMLISCFHASGEIWPELGEPLPQTPRIHEIAVYCNFPSPPRLRIKAPQWAFRRKLDAISAFRSQKQFKSLVEIVRSGGPVEYLRPVQFALYNVALYRDMFDEPRQMEMFR